MQLSALYVAQQFLKELWMCESFLSFPHVMSIEEEKAGNFLFIHLGCLLQNKFHDPLLVMLKKPEISVHPC
jgi:hypothetical protein